MGLVHHTTLPPKNPPILDNTQLDRPVCLIYQDTNTHFRFNFLSPYITNAKPMIGDGLPQNFSSFHFPILMPSPAGVRCISSAAFRYCSRDLVSFTVFLPVKNLFFASNISKNQNGRSKLHKDDRVGILDGTQRPSNSLDG